MSSFETHWVQPALPTVLGDRKFLPLPATDHNFYPMVNSWTIPEPLDVPRLKSALASALQLYPLNAAKLAASKNHDTWKLELANQAIPLTVGFSDRPGPFGATWTGEKDPDYYDELPRGGASLEEYSEITLTKIKVTTWRKTGQTSIMLSQSYNLGDGFAVMGFMTDLSDLYQGKVTSPQRTFEKFLLPDPHVEPSASHYDAMKGISWLAVEYDDDFHYNFTRNMEERTSRVDVTFEPWHVDAICRDIKAQAGRTALSTGDAMAGYLVNVLRSTLEKPPRYIQQCVGFRGQKLHINGTDYHIPYTSLGTCYIIYTLDLLLKAVKDTPAALASALSASRRELADPDYVSSVYALYSHLYKRANFARRLPIDSGHKDAIAINNCVKLNLTAPHFGFPGKSGHIEWEVLENFVQIMHANARQLPNGKWADVKGALSITTRLDKTVVGRFLHRLQADKQMYRESVNFPSGERAHL